MSRSMRRMLISVLIVFGILFGWYGLKKAFFYLYLAYYQPPAVTISATEAKAKSWQPYLSAVGNLSAVNGVELSSEAPGIVKEIRFSSGQGVKRGDILILLDTSVEEAQLKDMQAKLKLAEITYTRDKKLLEKNVTSQSQYDMSLAQLQEAQAGIEEVQAKIKQKTITAPFDGKVGICLVDLGQYISPGTTLVTLQSLNPLYVRFNLPEQYVNDLYLRQPLEVAITGKEGRVLQGNITAINAKVDQSSRNILVQGLIPNEALAFYPGMFAYIKVWLPTQNEVITVPQTAISYSLHGDYVFLIKEEGKTRKGPILKAYREYVSVGERRDAEVVITKGLKAGDRIVTSGQLKLQNGARVEIDDSVEL